MEDKFKHIPNDEKQNTPSVEENLNPISLESPNQNSV